MEANELVARLFEDVGNKVGVPANNDKRSREDYVQALLHRCKSLVGKCKYGFFGLSWKKTYKSDSMEITYGKYGGESRFEALDIFIGPYEIKAGLVEGESTWKCNVKIKGKKDHIFSSYS